MVGFRGARSGLHLHYKVMIVSLELPDIMRMCWRWIDLLLAASLRRGWTFDVVEKKLAGGPRQRLEVDLGGVLALQFFGGLGLHNLICT